MDAERVRLQPSGVADPAAEIDRRAEDQPHAVRSVDHLWHSPQNVADEAYSLANPPGDPDPWLDLQGLDEPLWGHHSFRRCADLVARATMVQTGATDWHRWVLP